MALAKLQYHTPHIKSFGTTRDVLLSDASPQVRQAVRAMADGRRKRLESRKEEHA